MAFKPTREYWINKIENITKAINGTRATMQTLTEQRSIDAHSAQLDYLEKRLIEESDNYQAWMKKAGVI